MHLIHIQSKESWAGLTSGVTDLQLKWLQCLLRRKGSHMLQMSYGDSGINTQFKQLLRFSYGRWNLTNSHVVFSLQEPRRKTCQSKSNRTKPQWEARLLDQHTQCHDHACNNVFWNFPKLRFADTKLTMSWLSDSGILSLRRTKNWFKALLLDAKGLISTHTTT